MFVKGIRKIKRPHLKASGALTLLLGTEYSLVARPMKVYTISFLGFSPRYSGRVRVPNTSLDGEGAAQMPSRRPYNKSAQNSSLRLFFCFGKRRIPGRH